MRDSFKQMLDRLVSPPSSKQQLGRLRQQLEQAEDQLQRIRKRNRRMNRQLKSTGRELAQVQLELKHTKQELRRTARAYLLLKMPKRSRCAEIGVDEGNFSKQILDTAEPEKLYLIDPWIHIEGERYQDSRYGGLGSSGYDVMNDRYRRVKERLAVEIGVGQVEVHREVSSEAADRFESCSLDWIYLDGNHLYEFVKQDLNSYYRKVKIGGYLTGDDYGAEGWWQNGVQKAVDEFVSQTPGLTLELRGSQFIIKKICGDDS